MGFRESTRGSFGLSEARTPRFTSPVQQNEVIDKSIAKQLEPEEDYRLGWEKAWDEYVGKLQKRLPDTDLWADPLGEATGGAGVALISRQAVKEVLNMVPFGKYIMPEEAMRLSDMSPEEKNSALAWEGVFAGLVFGVPLIGKLSKAGISKFSKWINTRHLAKEVPIEDAIATIEQKGIWKPFNYKQEAIRSLKGSQKGLGFSADEAEVIADVAAGNAGENALKSLAWEKGDKLSKAWKERIGRIGEPVKTRRAGVPDPGGATVTEVERRSAMFPREKSPDRRTVNAMINEDTFLRKSLTFDAEMKTLLEPTNLRAKYVKELYQENLNLMGKGTVKEFTEPMLRAQVSKFYGPEAGKNLNLGTLSEKDLSNYIAQMFEPAGQKFLTRAHRLGGDEALFTWFTPERHLYGFGETLYNTKTRLFDPLVKALGNSNKYTIEKMNTLMAMLQQRGFGTIVKEATGWKFKPNKALWNEDILEGTKELLQRIDNIASIGRRGKVLSKSEARAEIQSLMLKTKAKTPVIYELANLSREYSDILYKEMIQLYPTKIMEKLPLSEIGRAKLNQLSNLWSVRAEKGFSTASTLNAPQKVKFVQKMLKDFRELTKDRGNFLGEIPKEQLEEVLGRLAYGSRKAGAMPAYLEGYLPRIQQRGTSFMGFAKRALTGEAGFMKSRSSELSRNLGTFQEIFEARTRSQGKQLFFYDEAKEMVKYAQKLPEAWRAHFDFTLSRALNQPSVWDYRLSEVLKKLPGVSNMDEYRAMGIAKTITGMQYSGMLGLRPFAVFRNLTQPLLMTPSEMGGGVRDMASLIRGLFRSTTKEHRQYIQKIGAITEFIPDQQMRPMLPRQGFGASYDKVRDSFLYGFRMSDRFNRYWSGAAAIEKWNWAVASTNGGLNNLRGFINKVGLRHRANWAQAEIENLLRVGKFEEAKAYFVKDIIADTQYLYSTIDAPSAMGRGGVERAATTFQSWWMNYGNALRKWFLTGQGEDRVKKMGMAIMTAAFTEQVLEAYAGRGTAIRSIGMGPFPLGDLGVPPAAQPIIELLQISKNAFQGYAWNDQKSREAMVKDFYDLGKSASKMLPGGLAAQQLMKGYQRDKWPGALMGIMQKNPEKFEPFLGYGQ